MKHIGTGGIEPPPLRENRDEIFVNLLKEPLDMTHKSSSVLSIKLCPYKNQI